MLLLILVGVLLVIAFLYTPGISKQEVSLFTDVKQKAHVYSGFHPEYFMKFINNLELFEENINDVQLAATYLYRAIGFIEELAMYSDSDHVDDIHTLVPVIGVAGERILMDSALKNNMKFRPTYLKNIY